MLTVIRPSDRKEPQGMLAREEDVEAQALRAQGWSISAIARHLGRDRGTVRSHLNGERTPGVRRKTEDDPFDRFEPYVTQRLNDDPHLQLSTLLREVQVLGVWAFTETTS